MTVAHTVPAPAAPPAASVAGQLAELIRVTQAAIDAGQPGPLAAALDRGRLTAEALAAVWGEAYAAGLSAALGQTEVCTSCGAVFWAGQAHSCGSRYPQHARAAS